MIVETAKCTSWKAVCEPGIVKDSSDESSRTASMGLLLHPNRRLYEGGLLTENRVPVIRIYKNSSAMPYNNRLI